MRKLVVLAAAAAICGGCAGCFTSASAYTQRVDPDGTRTVSKVSVIGTGDKASDVVTEGLFADGEPNDLGAGVNKANVRQESTGTDQTLEGLSKLILTLVQAYTAFQTAGAAAVAPPVAP